MLRNTWAAACVCLMLACGGQTEDQETPPPVLLTAGEPEPDTVERHLIGLTRQLAEALAAPDSSALGPLLAGHFRAIDIRPPERNPEPPTAPVQYSYLEALAGRMAPIMSAEPDVFRAFSSGTEVNVYAFAGDDAVRARWKQEPEGWRATHLLLMTAATGRRNMNAHP
jgi:hypothetical protein